MCSYQPIGGQYYQVSKAKYILATLQKSAPVQQIISNTTMRKRKEKKTVKYLVSLNEGMQGCCIHQYGVPWRYVSVSGVVEILGQNLFFFCENGQRNFLRSLFRNQVKARGKREINCWPVHPITNI